MSFALMNIYFHLSSQTSFYIHKDQKNKTTDWVSLMNDTTSNFYEIQASFNAFMENKEIQNETDATNVEKEEAGWEIFKRWENFMEPRVYPTGVRPKSSIVAEEYDKFQKVYPVTKPVSSDKSATGGWTLLGPNGAPTGSVPNGSYQSPAGAGRVNCIRFNPLRSATMWIGTPSGGAWKSYNSGTNWIPAMDNTLSMGVSDIAVASDTNIIYVATGDADAGDTYSIGILKSTDAGSTWQTTSFSFGVSNGIKIYKLLAHPTNSDIIYIATNAGLYKTTDGMATYTRIGASTIGTCFDVEFKPGIPSTVYAAGANVWYSINDGSTWTASTGLTLASLQRMAIAVTPAAQNNVYVLLAKTDVSPYTHYGEFYGLYTSTNSGNSFSSTYADGTTHNLLGWNPNTFNDHGGQGWYDLSLTVSPTDATVMFVGGVNLQISTTSGSSWTTNAYWLSGAGIQYAHADHHDQL